MMNFMATRQLKKAGNVQWKAGKLSFTKELKEHFASNQANGNKSKEHLTEKWPDEIYQSTKKCLQICEYVPHCNTT